MGDDSDDMDWDWYYEKKHIREEMPDELWDKEFKELENEEVI